MHRVAVGAEPVSIAVNSANGRVYVANAGDGTLTILDGHFRRRCGHGSHRQSPLFRRSQLRHGKVYVTHTFGDQLTILDGATNTPSDLKTGSSDLIAINSRPGPFICSDMAVQ
jgi:DNA-binding beta-propeller fold protein YncE